MLRRTLEMIAVAIVATCIIIVSLPVWIVQGWLDRNKLPDYGAVRRAGDKK